MSAHQDRDGKLYTKIVKQMMIDYVVNDFTHVKLSEKYKITQAAVGNISRIHDFRKKRLEYQEKVLQKSVDNLATKHSFILAKLTGILDKQVQRIEKQMDENPTVPLDSKAMREVLNAFALLSKEHRLDNDKPTDSLTHTIKVEFGSAVPIVSDNHLHVDEPIVDAEIVEPKQVEEAPAEEEGADIADDDQIFGSID